MTLCEKLQKLRKARAWTQEELAEQVGVSRQSLSKWESDGALPDTANIILLADLFGVTTDYLLRDGEEVPTPTAPVESAAVPQVIQLIQPPKKTPPAMLLTGYILLALGLVIWLGLILLSMIFPVGAYVGDVLYTGVPGFLITYKLGKLYNGGLMLMMVGAVITAVYLLYQWRLNRRKDCH